MAFEVPALPYAYDALAPYIDQETMTLHHDKHHATYVTNLNNALADAPELQTKTAEALIGDLATVPEAIRTTVRNNAGGHVNHTMFWKSMSLNGGGEPTGALRDEIEAAWGDFATFKQQFNDAGAKRFGSGWVWVVRNNDGTLAITTTANQDNPLMERQTPLLGNDVWEHAYYITYRNRRAEYLEAWWNVVDWAAVGRR